MSDDYLWDRSGTPDPEIERLERVLGSLRSRRPAPALPSEGEPEPARAPSRRGWLVLVAAALGAAAIGLWAFRPTGPAALTVTRLEGEPRIGARAMQDRGVLRVGERLETDDASRASIAVGGIGVVEVGPGTSLRLVGTGAGVHRLALALGSIEARIWAPPRRFFVETPSAVAVDLGCSYTLEVDPLGTGVLRVRSGWVGFEKDGLESLIPEGAMCLTRPGAGPGTPCYEDAPEALRIALRRLDFDSPGPKLRGALLDEILTRARRRDALTLWHLLVRVSGGERARVYDALARLVPPPADVTREGVLGGDRRMLESWWDALGLGGTRWWRLWKLPEPPV